MVLKARRGAYDGKGNAVIRSEDGIDDAVASLGGLVDSSRASAGDEDEQFRLYAEKWVPFVRELAIMAVNNPAGTSDPGLSSDSSVSTYPVVVSQHQDSVLREAHVGSPAVGAVAIARAVALAKKVSRWLGPGVVGVEMFELEDGSVLYNECAPRPHNTGHYTIEACGVSQFEQLARVLAGMPTGSTALRKGTGGAIMYNILGGMTDRWLLEGVEEPSAVALRSRLAGLEAGGGAGTGVMVAGLKEPLENVPFDGGLRVHWYGKTALRKGRKMAHLTVTSHSFLSCLAAARRAGVPCEASDPALVPPAGSSAPAPGAEDASVSGSGSGAANGAGAGSGAAEGAGAVGEQPVPGTVHRTARDALATVEPPIVAIIMGSDSDLPHMEPACKLLETLQVPFEVTVVSAHRTPDRMFEYARAARGRGIRVIIAAAGGAAHLPGMVAALTPLPVIGVPVPLKHLDGVDSLHSIVQMPRGVPVATVAIGNADNAALLAVRMLGTGDASMLDKIEAYREKQKARVDGKIMRLGSMGWDGYSAV